MVLFCKTGEKYNIKFPLADRNSIVFIGHYFLSGTTFSVIKINLVIIDGRRVRWKAPSGWKAPSVKNILPFISNFFNVAETSVWADYTVDEDDEFKEFCLNLFASTESQKIQIMNAIKSSSFVDNFNRAVIIQSQAIMNWKEEFTGIKSASDPYVEDITGKKNNPSFVYHIKVFSCLPKYVFDFYCDYISVEMDEAKQTMRSDLLSKRFNEGEILSLYPVIEDKIKVVEIMKRHEAFSRNSPSHDSDDIDDSDDDSIEDAVISVYAKLLKGNFRLFV